MANEDYKHVYVCMYVYIYIYVYVQIYEYNRTNSENLFIGLAPLTEWVHEIIDIESTFKNSVWVL